MSIGGWATLTDRGTTSVWKTPSLSPCIFKKSVNIYQDYIKCMINITWNVTHSLSTFPSDLLFLFNLLTSAFCTYLWMILNQWVCYQGATRGAADLLPCLRYLVSDCLRTLVWEHTQGSEARHSYKRPLGGQEHTTLTWRPSQET